MTERLDVHITIPRLTNYEYVFLNERPKHNAKHLKKYRKELRNNLTPAEARLWTILKGKQIGGKKFRRQHSIDNFILDFYCPELKLAIELDGSPHFNAVAEEKDFLRDKYLEKVGIQVLRFENKIVFEHPEIIMEAILSMIE